MKASKKTVKSSHLITPGIFVAFLTVIASLLAALYFYPMMPEQMASHWEIDGQVNGYMDRFWGVLILPIVSGILLLLFMFVPKMDPKRNNIEKFRKHFDEFIVVIFFFLVYIYALTILWNLGYIFSMNKMIAPPFAVLFYYMGILLENTEANWTMGIRTPWTMESPSVWKKTNKLGGLLFRLCGVLSLIGLFLPDFTFYLILIPIISVTIFITFYSYYLFRKEIK